MISLLLLASVVAPGTTFTCTPVAVWDGDGPIWCREGPRIRLAGIAARELDGNCRQGHPCPRASGRAARDHLVKLLGGATPKTLRHTTLTWLAYQGVPKEQRSMIAGHLPSDTTSKYEHLTPDYLADAMAAIDRYFDEIREHLHSDLLPEATRHAPVLLTATPSANLS